jgi:hypothetical protein
MTVMARISDKKLKDLHELTLETVRLQRPSVSREEQRLLAENFVNVLLGRGLPEDSEDCSTATADASTSEFDDLIAQIVAGDPGANEQAIRAALQEARKAPDGRWYVPDPARPGKHLMIAPQPIEGPASTAAAQADASTNGLPPGRELTPSDESLVRSVMSNHGISREKAIEVLIAFGGI